MKETCTEDSEVPIRFVGLRRKGLVFLLHNSLYAIAEQRPYLFIPSGAQHAFGQICRTSVVVLSIMLVEPVLQFPPLLD